jgi:aminobenzoyl-glutamate utilization protein B
MSKTNKQAAFDWISRNEKFIIEISDAIWNSPELGLQEFKTSRICADTLEKNGFQLERGVAGMPTAFVATWGSGKPVIGIMAELDALPGLSQRAVPYREAFKEGAAGHGCGHNVFATSGVIGGIAAKVGMEEGCLKGTIKVLGCPAEETLVGKVFMVRDGYFNGLDACLGNHPDYANGVNLNPGTALNSFRLEFYGKASHAADSPEQGRSALDAVELMNVGVNFLREHVIQEARIHYVTEEGGIQPNVVPPYARSWYYVRAPLREVVDQIYERILKIANGADLMTETTHKIRFLTGCYQVLNNVTLSKLIVKEMQEIGAPTYGKEEYDFAKSLGKSMPREERIAALRRSHLPNLEQLVDDDINRNIYDHWGEEFYPDKGTGGSSDVGDVSWNTPTVHFRTAGFILGAPGHSWQNTAAMGMGIGHKAAIFGSKVIAATALDLLTHSDVVMKMQEEFKIVTKSFQYQSPLPPDAKPPLDQLKKQANEK